MSIKKFLDVFGIEVKKDGPKRSWIRSTVEFLGIFSTGAGAGYAVGEVHSGQGGLGAMIGAGIASIFGIGRESETRYALAKKLGLVEEEKTEEEKLLEKILKAVSEKEKPSEKEPEDLRRVVSSLVDTVEKIAAKMKIEDK